MFGLGSDSYITALHYGAGELLTCYLLWNVSVSVLDIIIYRDDVLQISELKLKAAVIPVQSGLS